MADPTLLINAHVAFSTATGSAVYTEIPGVKSVRLPFSAAELDDAVMGDTLDAKYPGIFSRPVDLECRNDFTTGTYTSAGGLDLMVHTRQTARSKFRVKIRPVDSAVSGTNPSFIFGAMRIFSSTPIDAAHGALLVNKISLRPASGCTFTRSTAT
jgi:hypothetical protein